MKGALISLSGFERATRADAQSYSIAEKFFVISTSA